MKYINGLYLSIIIMFFVQLASTTIFEDRYSGIAMFISLGVFIVGNLLFTNAKRLKISKQK